MTSGGNSPNKLQYVVSTVRDIKGWEDRRRDGCFLLVLSCLWASCTSTSRERQRQRDEEEEDEECELLTALSLQQSLSEQVIIDTHTDWSLITLSMLQYERSQTELVNYSRVWEDTPRLLLLSVSVVSSV